MQDDTPAETGWLYRRWYSFAGAAIIYVLLAIIIFLVGPGDPLKWIALGLIAWGAVKDGLYMAGASIIEYAKLAGAWKGNEVQDVVSMVTKTESTTEINSTGSSAVRDGRNTGNEE